MEAEGGPEDDENRPGGCSVRQPKTGTDPPGARRGHPVSREDMSHAPPCFSYLLVSVILMTRRRSKMRVVFGACRSGKTMGPQGKEVRLEGGGRSVIVSARGPGR